VEQAAAPYKRRRLHEVGDTAGGGDDAAVALLSKQGSAAWFAARSGRLTASRFGTAAGLSRYATPRSLWQLMSGSLGDSATEDSTSAAVQHGNRAEPEARGVYMLVTGAAVVETGLCVHHEHMWLGASPDGLVGDDGLIEIKCPVHQLHSCVPREYMAQVQGQLEVLGRGWCDFVSWRQGQLLIVRVRRSPAYWAWLFDRLLRFWRGVCSGKDPQLEVIAPRGGEQPPQVAQEVLYLGSFDINDFFG
jgi:putative phage-type endonuclease